VVLSLYNIALFLSRNWDIREVSVLGTSGEPVIDC